MNFYHIMGRFTAKFNYIFTKIGFKNIKSFTESEGVMKLQLTDNTEAEIRYFSPDTAYVSWSTHDFEQRARELSFPEDEEIPEDWEGWREVYDESKFYGALHEMIRKHDANYGITWYTIDYYLEEFCKIIK